MKLSKLILVTILIVVAAFITSLPTIMHLNAKKTASSLNSNNITNLKDLINTAKEAKAQTQHHQNPNNHLHRCLFG